MKPAIALDLTFETIEEIALEFHDLPATEAGHVNVIALGASFVEMLLPLHVHEIEFINQSMSLQQAKRAVNGNAVNPRIQFAGVAQNLRGVKMLLSGFHNAEDRASLAGEANAARGERSLQSTRCFGLGQWHSETELQ